MQPLLGTDSCCNKLMLKALITFLLTRENFHFIHRGIRNWLLSSADQTNPNKITHSFWRTKWVNWLRKKNQWGCFYWSPKQQIQMLSYVRRYYVQLNSTNKILQMVWNHSNVLGKDRYIFIVEFCVLFLDSLWASSELIWSCWERRISHPDTSVGDKRI